MHNSKGNSYSGSTAWHNSARSRLAILDADGGGIELVQEKSNLGRLCQPVRLTWGEGGVLVPMAAEEAQRAAETARSIVGASDDECVLSAVLSACAAGITVPASKSGPNSVWHFLQSAAEVPEPLRDRSGMQRLRASLARLERAGRVVEEAYQDHNRNHKKRLRAVCVSE